MAELNKRERAYLDKMYQERYTLGRFLMYLCLKGDAERREERKKLKQKVKKCVGK